jgi:Delta7-sterol 5-desaturase
MRRELSLVGASLVVYACALVLGTLVICGTGQASEIVGEWATQGNAAHVRIERCSTAPELLCGLVTWLWEPIDADGEPVRDKHNPDSRLRARTVVGLSLLEDFRGGATGEALEGRIYNPENGRTYRAVLKLRSPDILEVKGCVLIVCDTQVWRRLESLCGKLPKQAHVAGTAANRGIE